MNKKAIDDYKLLLFLIASMWLIEIVNLIFEHQLNNYSLYPREIGNLYGIVSMHFLHWNLSHLISNSVPLLILGFFASHLGKLKEVTFLIMVISGGIVWVFAREGFHAGASGLVMGYWGYLISCAFFERVLKNILIALTTIIIYGGILFSLIDLRQSISFEAHISGFLSGIISAWLWHSKIK